MPDNIEDARELLKDALSGLKVLRTIGRARSYKDRDKAITDWGKPVMETCDRMIAEIEEYLLETGRVIQSARSSEIVSGEAQELAGSPRKVGEDGRKVGSK